MSQVENGLGEEFSETHRKIVECIGAIASDLGANSGVMAIIMSWGDTMNSEQTVDMAMDYIEKFLPHRLLSNTEPQEC